MRASPPSWGNLRPIAALVISMAAGCGGADDPGPQSGAFDALTYNVAGLPEGLSSSSPEANIPLISPLLNGYDLVLVQEDFAYHEQLIAEADHPHQSEPKEFHVQLVDDGLNRFSELAWSDFERVQWVACYGDADSGASDCLAEKGFTFARTTLGPGVTVDVYNHHAEAGGGPEDIAAREAGFEQLIAFVAERSAGRAVILAGDTNLHGDDAADRPLIDAVKQQLDLTDACEALSCGDDRIDRFFYRSSDALRVEAVTWRIGDEFVDAEGAPLSDHLAVHVAFEWATL